MRRPHLDHFVSPLSMPEIRKVATDRPWFWLSDGWRDFIASPGISLIYGFTIALFFNMVGYLLTTRGIWHWAFALMPAFFFVGPLMAVGLYEISRRREGEMSSSLRESLHGWTRNAVTTAGLATIMVLLLLTWFMTAFQLTALFVANTEVMTTVFGGTMALSGFLALLTWPMLAAFALSGIACLSVAFLFAAFSLPLAADYEDVDVITAVVISVKAVMLNWRPMLLWAGLIVVFAGVGIVPLYLGLVITFPWLGYATWHAYRDVLG